MTEGMQQLDYGVVLYFFFLFWIQHSRIRWHMSECKFHNPRFFISTQMKESRLRARKPRKWLVYRACMSNGLVVQQTFPPLCGSATWEKWTFNAVRFYGCSSCFCLTCTKVRFTISPDSLVLHSLRLMDFSDMSVAYIFALETILRVN